MRRLRGVKGVLFVLALVTILWRMGCYRPALRIGTFNIENYPKSAAQESGALSLIERLHASAVAVQEITDPDRFAEAARGKLGDSWRFVYAHRGNKWRVGLLFDDRALELTATDEHPETEIDGRGKPTLEARFEPRAGGDGVRIFVVHLKSGGEWIDFRRSQLRALHRVMRSARASGDRVVILGDFNATSDEDRREIALLAKEGGLEWASEDLECTSYWNRRDGCLGSALDHVLETRGSAARVWGPCATEGCGRRDRCPIYVEQISDHCPVSVDLR